MKKSIVGHNVYFDCELLKGTLEFETTDESVY